MQEWIDEQEQLGLNRGNASAEADTPKPTSNTTPHMGQDFRSFGEERESEFGGDQGEDDGGGMVGKWGQKRPRVDTGKRVPSKRLTMDGIPQGEGGAGNGFSQHPPTSPPKRGVTRWV